MPKVQLVDQVAEDYVTYALSTLGRAIPSVLDGLKTSQRRILQCAMLEGLTPDSKHIKSARLAGSVMGKLHPHSSTYGAMVNMASPANMPHPLLNLHGNGGGFAPNGAKISNDGPAAERYTELKLSPFAYDVYFGDGSYKFCQTRPNYDGTLQEIVEFVPALPMALLTSNEGIACGYASSMQAYNLLELSKYIAKQSAKKPCFDMPAGCSIVKEQSLADCIAGRGSFSTIGKYNLMQDGIEVVELPTGSAETFVHKVRDAYQAGKIPMLGDVQDLSDQNGIRVLVKLKARQKSKLAELEACLLRYTNLSAKLSINQTLLVNNVPVQLDLDGILQHWLEARKACLQLAFEAEQEALQNKASFLLALHACIATDKAKRLFADTVMLADSPVGALQSAFNISESHAKSILDLPIRRVTKQDADKLLVEVEQIKSRLSELKALLNGGIVPYIVEQVQNLAKKHGIKRRTNFTEGKMLPKLEPAPQAKPALSKAEQWLNKAVEQGASMAKPLKRKAVLKFVDEYYAGKHGSKTLDEAWQELLATRVDDYQLADIECDKAGVARLGRRAITLAIKQNKLASRLKEHITYLQTHAK